MKDTVRKLQILLLLAIAACISCILIYFFSVSSPVYTRLPMEGSFSARSNTAAQLLAEGSTGQVLVVSDDTNSIYIYNRQKDDQLLVTRFDRKSWGTININGWYTPTDNAVPSKQLKCITGGDSDWEYVLTASKYDHCFYGFSGGSHGCEKLESFKILDNRKREISFTSGSRSASPLFRIEETTQLSSPNEDLSVMYFPDNSYATVHRVYTITPEKVELDTTFEFTADTYMSSSYFCMFPVSKMYGSHIRYLSSRNVYSTPQEGTTLSTPEHSNYLGMEPSLAVEIWGDGDPAYLFRVGIKDSRIVDDFKNKLKVFYWDCNAYSNKLYFSKYDDEASVLVPKGAVWHNSAYWELTVR